MRLKRISASLLFASPFALLLACGADVDGSPDDIGQTNEALTVNGSNDQFTVTWTNLGAFNARKIAACNRDDLYYLRTDQRMFQTASFPGALAWEVANLPWTINTACIGPFIYAQNIDGGFWLTTRSVPFNWNYLSNTSGTEQISGGYNILYALNFDKSIYTDDGHQSMFPGAGNWTFRVNDPSAIRVTGSEAHPNTTPLKNNTRTFMLKNDRTLHYRDNVFQLPGVAPAPWRPFPNGGITIAEIAAGDSNLLFAVDTGGAIWRADIKEFGCYDRTDNDNDSSVDENDSSICKAFPGNASVVTTVDCNAGGISDGITSLCNAFPGCSATLTRSCKTQQREIFTGTVLETTPRPNWDYFGGPGKHLGEAALCMMRDLHKVPDPAPLRVGPNTEVWQKVGRLDFDPATRTIKGYRRLSFKMPAFGTIDTRAQTFTAKLVSTPMPTVPVDGQNVPLFGGDYRMSESVALLTTADEADQTITVNPPKITVVTPYGVTIDLSVAYSYGSTNPVLTSPFINTTSTLSDILFARKPRVYDVHDRTIGAKLTDELRPLTTVDPGGWASHMGIGSRRPDVAWTGSGDRPDLKLSQARSSREETPTAAARASAQGVAHAAGMLPAPLREAPLVPTLDVTLNPYYFAQVGGQFQIYFQEAAVPPGDLSQSTVSKESVFLKSGFGGYAKFALAFNILIDVKLQLPSPIGDKTLLHYENNFEIPLSEGPRDKRENVSAAIGTITARPEVGWTYNGQSTNVNGATISDPRAYVNQCLAEPRQTGTMPPAGYTPGNPDDLKPPEWPCNICAWTDGFVGSGVDRFGRPYNINQARGGVTLAPSNPLPSWRCDRKEKADAHCMDMCTYNPATGALTVTKSAPQLIGPVCAWPPPIQ